MLSPECWEGFEELELRRGWTNFRLNDFEGDFVFVVSVIARFGSVVLDEEPTVSVEAYEWIGVLCGATGGEGEVMLALETRRRGVLGISGPVVLMGESIRGVVPTRTARAFTSISRDTDQSSTQ